MMCCIATAIGHCQICCGCREAADRAAIQRQTQIQDEYKTKAGCSYAAAATAEPTCKGVLAVCHLVIQRGAPVTDD